MEINRHLNMLDYTLRAMARRWRYHLFVFIILSIAVFTAASLVLMVESLDKETTAMLDAAPDITVIEQTLGRQVPIEKQKAGAIRRIPGVSSATPRVWGVYADPYSRALFTLWGVDGSVQGRFRSQGLAVIQGGFWKQGEQHKVVVGQGVLQHLGLEKRKNFALQNATGELVNFEVTGVFSASSALLTADLILMDEKDIHAFFNLPLEWGADIAVYVANPLEIPTIANKIQQHFPSCTCIQKSRLTYAYAAAFDHRAGLLLYSWIGCGMAYVLVLWIRGSYMPREEQQELGLLKASGWGISDILEMKFFEALTLGFLAFGIGFCAAYAHIFIGGAPLFKPLLLGWSVLYPDFEWVPRVSFGRLILIFVFTSLPYIGITLMASWKSCSGDVAELLLGDAP